MTREWVDHRNMILLEPGFILEPIKGSGICKSKTVRAKPQMLSYSRLEPFLRHRLLAEKLQLLGSSSGSRDRTLKTSYHINYSGPQLNRSIQERHH
jgi:hypothetical protein